MAVPSSPELPRTPDGQAPGADMDASDANHCQKTIHLRKDQVGYVVGRSGTHIKAIRTASGASVDTDKETHGDAARGSFTISGTGEQVRVCEAMIRERLSKLDEPRSIGLEDIHMSVWVPELKVGLVIGVSGTNVKGIIKQSNAGVKLQNGVVRDGCKRIDVTGPRECVEEARRMILEYAGEAQGGCSWEEVDPPTGAANAPPRDSYDSRGGGRDRDDRGGDAQSRRFTIPVDADPAISDPDFLRDLEDRTHARIRLLSREHVIIVEGQVDHVDRAYGMLEDRVGGGRAPRRAMDEGSDEKRTDRSLVVGIDVIRLIIGKSGRVVRDLQARSGAAISTDAPDAGGGRNNSMKTVSIRGTSRQIETAHDLIARILDDHYRNKADGGMRRSEHGSRDRYGSADRYGGSGDRYGGGEDRYGGGGSRYGGGSDRYGAGSARYGGNGDRYGGGDKYGNGGGGRSGYEAPQRGRFGYDNGPSGRHESRYDDGPYGGRGRAPSPRGGGAGASGSGAPDYDAYRREGPPASGGRYARSPRGRSVSPRADDPYSSGRAPEPRRSDDAAMYHDRRPDSPGAYRNGGERDMAVSTDRYATRDGGSSDRRMMDDAGGARGAHWDSADRTRRYEDEPSRSNGERRPEDDPRGSSGSAMDPHGRDSALRRDDEYGRMPPPVATGYERSPPFDGGRGDMKRRSGDLPDPDGRSKRVRRHSPVTPSSSDKSDRRGRLPPRADYDMNGGRDNGMKDADGRHDAHPDWKRSAESPRRY